MTEPTFEQAQAQIIKLVAAWQAENGVPVFRDEWVAMSIRVLDSLCRDERMAIVTDWLAEKIHPDQVENNDGVEAVRNYVENHGGFVQVEIDAIMPQVTLASRFINAEKPERPS